MDVTLAEVRSGASSYYQHDGLGSVTSLGNAITFLSNSYVYDAFGNLASSSGGTPNQLQYAGRDFDPETGLRYYRARYYDSSIGRFINEDPVEFDGDDLNFYAYVGNSPIIYLDPFGEGRLPGDPSGLGPQWTPDPTHQYPNGQRFTNPNGDILDFHKGQSGKPGWRGRDHWHWNKEKKHLKPGDEVPADTECPKKEEPKTEEKPKAQELRGLPPGYVCEAMWDDGRCVRMRPSWNPGTGPPIPLDPVPSLPNLPKVTIPEMTMGEPIFAPGAM